jgi:hypothetical protein
MANDDISSLEFDEVAERFFASEVGKKLRERYAAASDEPNEDKVEFCEYCPW